MWHPFISFLFSKLRETFNQIFHDISTIILRSSNKLKQTEADLLPNFFCDCLRRAARSSVTANATGGRRMRLDPPWHSH